MKQTRWQSAAETMAQTVIGLVLAIVLGQWVIYPLFNVHPTWTANISMTLLFTVQSIVRGYLIRRLFNWWNFRDE
jgi:hypothetical protein